jgi:predicted esterase
VGEVGPAIHDVWIVCHGYGQLAKDFVAQFVAIADSTRLVVAPEGLSRFYAESLRGGSHAGSPVGASWMTREDRASEIADQVTYLDAVHDRMFADVDRDAASLTVLGFSQGVATACRWLDHTDRRADRLICWGGAIPDDVHLRPASGVRRSLLRLVVGTRDEFATPDRMGRQEAVLEAAGASYARIDFQGGHRLDDATLRQLADELL